MARPKLSTTAPHAARPGPKTVQPWRSDGRPANAIRILAPDGSFGRFHKEKRRPGTVPGSCSAFRRMWRAPTLKRRHHGARLHPRLIKSAFWAQTAVSDVFKERSGALEPLLAATPLSAMAPQVARPTFSPAAPQVAYPDPKTAPPWRSAAPPANQIRILGPAGGFLRFRAADARERVQFEFQTAPGTPTWHNRIGHMWCHGWSVDVI